MKEIDREVNCGYRRDLDIENARLLAVLDMLCSQYIECLSVNCVNWKKYEHPQLFFIYQRNPE